MKILIGEEEFRTKTEAIKLCQEVINSNKGKQILSTERFFVYSLLLKHPEAERKIGVGVDGFYVDVAPNGFNNYCFYVRRTDGSITDFSWRACLTAPTQEENVLAAMRQAIVDQIIECKKEAFSKTNILSCPITHTSLMWSNCHVDHVIPFRKLANDWVKIQKRSWDDFKINKTDDNSAVTTFEDQEDAKSWSDYHKKYALLRCISAKANLQRKRS